MPFLTLMYVEIRLHCLLQLFREGGPKVRISQLLCSSALQGLYHKGLGRA